MAFQRFKEVFSVALILGCINTAGVNSVELNSTNFASTTEVTTKVDVVEAVHTDTKSTESLASKLSLSETSETKTNLTEARITSITFRSEEADVDKENNDETISFGIRSFTVEIATPATEKPIPLNEKVGAASKINVQQAVASSLPILTLESDPDRNDKVSNERTKVFAAPLPAVADTLTPKSTEHAENKQENVASTVATRIDANEKSSANVPRSNAVDDNDDAIPGAHLQWTTTMAPVKLTQNGEQSSVRNNNEHKQLSISSNGMHVEQKLENGLYRIKIAEIITDEFNNGQANTDAKRVFDEKQKLNEKDDDAVHLPSFASSHPSGQINIADLYPSKLEDFSSIIRESNEKLIEEKNRFVGIEKSGGGDQPIISDARFNIIDDGNEQENSIQFGNEGDANVDHQKQEQQQQQHTKVNGAFNSIENNIPTTKIEIELIDEPGMSASKDDVKIIGPGDDDDYVGPVERANGPNNDKVTDFTSELQLKDDMVSKIEQSFRESSMTNIQQPLPLPQQQQQQQQQPITINHPINPMGYIERRVKKFDPTFRKRFMPYDGNKNRASSLPEPAITKSIDENIISQSDEERKLDADIPNAKFYHGKDGTSSETTVNPNKSIANKQTNNNANSSKSQTAGKNNKADDLIEHESNGGAESSSGAHGSDTAKKENQILSTLEPMNPAERKILFINVNSGSNGTIDKTELERMQRDREQIIKESHLNTNTSADKMNGTDAATAKPSTNMHLYIIHDDPISQKPSESIKTNYTDANQQSPTVTPTPSPIASSTTTTLPVEVHPSDVVVKQNQTTSKEPSAATPALIDTISSTESNPDKHSSSLNSIKSITQSPVETETAAAATSTATVAPLSTSTMQTKSRAMNFGLKQKPFGRRGFEGFYFETECDMQTPLPSESTVWRGNETHELNLPTTTPENCSGGGDCMPMIISWEGAAEIQSGDVLIVEIDDTLLLPADMNPSQANNNIDNGHRIATAVYQVTRPGHEHCDATEGILLDITPLVVDGKKLVTLYDKDLTEGVNLLIVVSDLWGPQCVRLKVTVKSDNCGENAQCNAKGVCFSNASMEGYECQCCTGFAGSHCEEIDACSPSPCTNNGICVDLSQGHDGNSYQCLCPYGYTGKNCQFESDPCQNGECQNGGTCTGNATHFRCECTPGFTGPLCQHNLNECESSPCVHGICVDQEDGFRCFCQPGFSGEYCNYEYNECDSNPCLNDGQCTDHIGGFSCKCTRGYTGKRCHIKKCNINPCANGGSCWTSEESFYCACRAGFTGKMCEDEFILDGVVNTNDVLSDADSATTHARPFADSSFSAVISKGNTVGLHNAYIAVGTFATAIFIVAIVVIVCHCKFHKSYRRFTTRQHQLIPIFGFGRRAKQQLNNPRHWLSGKGHLSSSNKIASTTALNQPNGSNGNNAGGGTNSALNYHPPPLSQQVPRFQRHLAMNLENDMYYTVDFSDSQHSPLIH
ncbi:dual specificity protein kinase splB isoform X2 [Sitodiplosis mosellana]|uniref:dual specificity protein kinase splB isoform X2 n=1 Tax=Sitodiplosis mosellana TaxID=263140 RepID=UPI002443D33E|nr:dual specificity protein kinase splB isoform X2 [Sitodiplosis mosellana]